MRLWQEIQVLLWEELNLGNLGQLVFEEGEIRMKQWKRWLCCLLAALLLGTVAPAAGMEVNGLPAMAEAAAKPKLNKSSLTLTVGKTYTLKLANAKSVTWKSNDKKIAKISSKGKVTAVKAGTTKVYAVYKSKKYYCKVTVKKAAASNTSQTAADREKLAQKEVDAIIAQEGMASLSPIEKVKAVHDYLVLNAEYDVENLEKNTIPDESHEAYGILVKKIGVCDGYAWAFQMFMDKLDVLCEFVGGVSGGVGHAWNVVTLDGERYHIDVTFDDPTPDRKGLVSYNYFLLDDKTMSVDHTWTFLTKPCNGTKYRLYPYEALGVKADSLEEIRGIIEQQYAAGTAERCDIQILAKYDIKERDFLPYFREIVPEEEQKNWYYYPVVKIGEYYLYHYFTGGATQYQQNKSFAREALRKEAVPLAFSN